ncbi:MULTISPECIES: ferredoxin [Streptomyces]|uniref:Ferredoxin n=1 Tax=Streptomyces nanshensis TaxID=518642 RepID=A0A1E7L5P8_9ACTN|nr:MULTISPECIES: ferredoxin [Streptomyces]OEV11504.1 ferredoxin [Streptomyces nanshensis]
MKVEVDEQRCVSAGHCVTSAPDVFDQRDDDGVVHLLDGAPPERRHEQVREAALLCPAAAILLRERDGSA